MIPKWNIVNQFREMEGRKMFEATETYSLMTTPQDRNDMEMGRAIRHFFILKKMNVLDYCTLGETAAKDKLTAIIRPVGAKILFATNEDYLVLATDFKSIIEHFVVKYELVKSEAKEDEVPF